MSKQTFSPTRRANETIAFFSPQKRISRPYRRASLTASSFGGDACRSDSGRIVGDEAAGKSTRLMPEASTGGTSLHVYGDHAAPVLPRLGHLRTNELSETLAASLLAVFSTVEVSSLSVCRRRCAGGRVSPHLALFPHEYRCRHGYLRILVSARTLRADLSCLFWDVGCRSIRLRVKLIWTAILL